MFIIPHTKTKGESLQEGIAQGLQTGLQSLSAELQKHRDQKLATEGLKKIPKDASLRDQLIAITNIQGLNDQLKGHLMSGLVTQEHYKQQADIARAKEQAKLIDEIASNENLYTNYNNYYFYSYINETILISSKPIKKT